MRYALGDVDELRGTGVWSFVKADRVPLDKKDDGKAKPKDAPSKKKA